MCAANNGGNKRRYTPLVILNSLFTVPFSLFIAHLHKPFVKFIGELTFLKGSFYRSYSKAAGFRGGVGGALCGRLL
jgi:hypothetical protein